jgi:hypothetical protein
MVGCDQQSQPYMPPPRLRHDLPPKPRKPQPQNERQHELPQVPQLSLVVRGVSQPLAGMPSQSPHPVTQPLHVCAGEHCVLFGQSLSAQHG